MYRGRAAQRLRMDTDRRPYAPVGHIPPIPRHGSSSALRCAPADRPTPNAHIRLPGAHPPSPITIMPRVPPGRISRSIMPRKNTKDDRDDIRGSLCKFVQEIRMSGRRGQFDLGGRFALPLSLRPFPKSPVVVSQTAAAAASTTDREKPGRVLRATAEIPAHNRRVSARARSGSGRREGEDRTGGEENVV